MIYVIDSQGWLTLPHLASNRPNGYQRRALRRKLLAGRRFAACHYCRFVMHRKELTMDHMIPVFLGGESVLSNLVLACRPCNEAKGRTPYAEFVDARRHA